MPAANRLALLLLAYTLWPIAHIAWAQALKANEIAGKWNLSQGLTPYSSKAYSGSVTVTPLGGPVVGMQWQVGKEVRHGVGLIIGHEVLVSYDRGASINATVADLGLAYYEKCAEGWDGNWASLGEQDEYVANNGVVHTERLLSFVPYNPSGTYTVTNEPFTSDEPYFGQLSIIKTGLHAATASWSSGAAGLAWVDDQRLAIAWRTDNQASGLMLAIYKFTDHTATGLFIRPGDDVAGEEALSR